MLCTCNHVRIMKMLQIRNVPDDLHRALKERAAREGTTMSELVLRELPRVAYKPSPEEVMARILRMPPVGGPSGAELVRESREERDRELERRFRESG
jgi:plasmid stability protein